MHALASKPFQLGLCGLAFLALSPVAAAGKFTIAVISDTQNYVDVTLQQPRGIDTYTQQMQYLVDHQADKNLVFATHVGDIVQHGDGQFRTGSSGNYTYWNTKQEWTYANQAMSILSSNGIPFGVVPGNHDYDNYSYWNGANSPGASRPLSTLTTFNTYFGASSGHFAGKSWYGGSDGINSYQVFYGGGQKFINLSLEHEPTLADLNWAQGVINANPGVPTIITTHEWIDPNFTGSTNRSNDYNSYFNGTNHQTPDQVWDKFIRKNDQIFMVLSGHDWTGTVNGVSNGENLRTDLNDAGHPVYQLVQDYQGNTIGQAGTAGSANGGAGWLRFIEFDSDAKTMHFYTYSTLLDKYAGQNGEATFGVPAAYSDFTLPYAAQMVPEPATWGFMLSGLGLVGVVLRRRA